MEAEAHYENHGGAAEGAYAAVDRSKDGALTASDGHYEDTLAATASANAYGSLNRTGAPVPIGYAEPTNNQPVSSHYMTTTEATGEGEVQQDFNYAAVKVNKGDAAETPEAAEPSAASGADADDAADASKTVYSTVSTLPNDVIRSDSVGSDYRVNPEASMGSARLSGDYDQTH